MPTDAVSRTANFKRPVGINGLRHLAKGCTKQLVDAGIELLPLESGVVETVAVTNLATGRITHANVYLLFFILFQNCFILLLSHVFYPIKFLSY